MSYYYYSGRYNTSRYVHSERISQLNEMRHDFCGMDTRNVKLFLNNAAKTDDVALAYRYLLEAEDYNVKAKDYWGDYKESAYNRKEENILKVVDICKKHTDWLWGIQPSDVAGVSWIIYFEIPGCEQVSFHTKLNCSGYPKYKKEWDEKENSTLLKLEEAIDKRYGEQLKDKRAAYQKKQELKRQKERELAEQRERERIERLLSYSSAELMQEKSEHIMKMLTKLSNTLGYVRVKYRDDGLFVSTDDTDKKFNLYLVSDTLQIYKNINNTVVNNDGYDAFVEVYKIIDLTTGAFINDRYEEAVAERERKRQEQEEKERLRLEALRKYETFYISDLSQISKSLSNKFFVVDEISEDGELYYIKKKKKVCFNPLKDENGRYVLVGEEIREDSKKYFVVFNTYLSKTGYRVYKSKK